MLAINAKDMTDVRDVLLSHAQKKLTFAILAK